MIDKVHQFFERQHEPIRGSMLYVHGLFTQQFGLKTAWKYGAPFYMLGKHNVAYTWRAQDHSTYYIGFMEGHRMKHPLLESEGRKRVKILRINAEQDIDLEALKEVMHEAIRCTKTRFEKH